MQAEQKKGGWVGAIVAGCILGVLVAGGLSGLVGYVLVTKKHADVRKGWNLGPVMVASRDLRAGQVLRTEDVAERSIPEQLVTSSIVKPGSMTDVVGQLIAVDVKAGEPLRSSYFPSSKNSDPAALPLYSACGKAHREAAARGRIKRPETIEELRARLQQEARR